MPFFGKQSDVTNSMFRLLYHSRDALLLATGIEQFRAAIEPNIRPFTADELEEFRQDALFTGTALTVSALALLERSRESSSSSIPRNVAIEPDIENVVLAFKAMLQGQTSQRATVDWDGPLATMIAGYLARLRSGEKLHRAETKVFPDYGLHLMNRGLAGVYHFFYELPIVHLSRTGPDSFTTMLNRIEDEEEFAMSLDFDREVAESIIRRLEPHGLAPVLEWIRDEDPESLTWEFDSPILISFRGSLGTMQSGIRENFCPIIIEELF